jgi:Cu/Ag efflux protein CusF
MTRRVFTLAVAAGVVCAQDKNAKDKHAGKKVYTFHGKIESISASEKSMSINGENVDGWMAAMTMIYPVDNAEVFKTAKVGDSIEATVYQDDYTLYNVRVVSPQKKK